VREQLAVQVSRLGAAGNQLKGSDAWSHSAKNELKLGDLPAFFLHNGASG